MSDTIGGGKLSKKDKLLDKLKRNPKNIDLHTFKSALKAYGFTINESGGKGSHFKYYHLDHNHIEIRVVNLSKPIRKHHIETLISDIEEVKK